MSTAYSEFFASGLQNSRTKPLFSSMALDIPAAGAFSDGCSRTSSPTVDSPLTYAMDVDADTTPTMAHTAVTPKGVQGRILRKRRSSLSLAVGAQGNVTAIKGPSRSIQVSRARSGSTASYTAPDSNEALHSGRSRSGSIGSALKSTKSRSMKTLAPPLPPPKSPLPDLPSFRSALTEAPGTAPPDMSTFNIPMRFPLTTRASYQYSAHHDTALKSSPIREDFTFDGHWQMKEN